MKEQEEWLQISDEGSKRLRGFEFVRKTNEYGELVEDCGLHVVKYSTAQLPVYSTKRSAGADFFCAERVEIPSIWNLNGAGLKPTLVHTGIKAYMQEDEELELYNRSGGPKRGLVLANGVGVIDADYYDAEGEILFAFYNFSQETLVVEVGDKIGQGVFRKFLRADNAKVLDAERTGGFGSTG